MSKPNLNRVKAGDLELKDKVVAINRVVKTTKGGRAFSFSALVVVGNGSGVVGHGLGKAKEVQEAITSLTEELETVEARLNEIIAIEEKISQCKTNIIELNTKIIACQEYIKKLQDEIETSTNSNSSIEEEKAKLKGLEIGRAHV